VDRKSLDKNEVDALQRVLLWGGVVPLLRELKACWVLWIFFLLGSG